MEIKFRVRLKSKSNTRDLIIYYTLESLINGQMWNRNLYTYEILGLFTGLKDKNGEGIYEGDICRQGDTLKKILFENGCFMAVTYREDGSRIFSAPFGYNGSEDLLEVIGNIYENPELIP